MARFVDFKMWVTQTLRYIYECPCKKSNCHASLLTCLLIFLDLIGDDQHISYDIYELPGEDRLFYVIHFYKRWRDYGFQDNYSLGQLTADLSGTIAVSLGSEVWRCAWKLNFNKGHLVAPGSLHVNYLHNPHSNKSLS